MVERWVVGAMMLVACTGTFHHPVLEPIADQRRLVSHTLPSGLRVVLETERGSRRVGIAVLVGAGADDDPVGREGLAHLLEHLAFRSRPAHRRTAWEELDAAGLASRGSSQSNANTTFGATTFLGTTATARLPQVLPLMASLVVAPLESVDTPVIDVERSVVGSERYDVDPHAGLQTFDATFAAVLPAGAPGSRPIMGTDASLAAITRADLEAFVALHYRPENVIVCLTGDFDPEAIGQLLEQAFPSSWVQASPPRPALRPEGAVVARVLDPPPESPVRPVVESRVPQRRLVIAWAVPGEAVPSGLAMPGVVDALRRRLPHDLPGVTRASVTLIVDSEVSALAIIAELTPEARPDAVSAAIRARVPLGGVPPPPKPTLLEVAAFVEENLETRAERRARALFATGSPEPPEAGDLYRNAAALKVVEDQVITWERAREVLVQPLVRRVVPPLPLAVPVDEPPPRVQLTPEALASVALGPPLGELRRFTLRNGLGVLLSSRSGAPVVSVALGLRARRADTTPEVAAFLEDMIVWKSRAVTARVPRPGVIVGADATVVHLSGRAELLPAMLDLLGDNPSPSVRWTGFGAIDAAVKDAVTTSPAENPWHRVLQRVMPPGSAALPVVPTELKAPSNWDIADFVGRAWNPEGASLVIDGSLNLDLTESIVRDAFSHWRGRSPPSRDPAGGAPRHDPRPRIIENQDAAMTTVRMACRLPAGRDDRGLQPLAGNALLAQALLKTLEDDLRTSRGVTYGVTVEATRFLDEANALLVQLRLDPRDHQQAARHLLERLADLDGLLWSERDLDLARWHVAKERLGTALDSVSVSEWLASVGASGVPLQAVFPAALAVAPAHVVDDAWAACLDTLAIELEGERSSLQALLSK